LTGQLYSKQATGLADEGDTMSKDDGSKRPASDDFASWRDYWTSQGMPWRTEPEIPVERQSYLTERRMVQPDIVTGIYPFRDETGRVALTRADVEWLLASHEDERGPLHPGQEQTRPGLDLRGADVSDTDLHGLPLMSMRGSLTWDEAGPEQTDVVEPATMRCERTNLQRADLSGAQLRQGHLQDADLRHATLLQAELYGADLRGTQLTQARVARTNLRRAQFGPSTNLYGIVLSEKGYGEPRLRDIRWNSVDLTVVDWSQIEQLGDERVARQRKRPTPLHDFRNATRAYRQLATTLRAQGLNEDADRFAYRAQLCQRVVLRRQRHYLRSGGSLLLWLISGYGYKPIRSVITYLLVILSFATAYFVLTNFALTPFLPSHSSPLAWYEAIVLSISSFHGRGLFPSGLSLGDPLAILAAFEAIIGLLIEITFIATFTQRFFAR
jgi:hypothetical protein